MTIGSLCQITLQKSTLSNPKRFGLAWVGISGRKSKKRILSGEEQNRGGNDMRFRKRPIVIEAFQMTKERLTKERRWDNSEWPDWLHQAWNAELGKPGSLFVDQTTPTGADLRIETLEGDHHITWGDWIIRGVKGELYPCKPDIFEATYEPAE